MIRIAVLVSGDGSNLQALLDAQKRGENADGRIVLVIGDRRCTALERAERHDIEAVGLDRRTLGGKAFESRLLACLGQHNIDLIVLAGFLSILSCEVTERYRRRIINIHPSLIPSFCGKGYYGLRVHQAALHRGVKISGATVHLVDEVADGGPILAQQAIDVLGDDTPSSLGRRILEQVEWKLLPRTVASYCLYMERNMSLLQNLAANRYPGRGIVCGLNERGNAIIAYFITARSSHSKNRCLVAEGDTVRTKAVDESLLVDPSLIIYRAMDRLGEDVVVANGDQSDTILDGLRQGRTLQASLESRTFEPDAPNYTPRISGLFHLGQDPFYTLSILRRSDDGSCDRSYYSYTEVEKGKAHLIHTYEGDGNPLPGFTGEPREVDLAGDADSIADRIWEMLDRQYRVAVCVKEITLTGTDAVFAIRQGADNGLN